jgi:hypothetical protein
MEPTIFTLDAAGVAGADLLASALSAVEGEPPGPLAASQRAWGRGG